MARSLPARFAAQFSERVWFGAVVIAAVFATITFVAAGIVGMPVRDPEQRYGLAFASALLVIALAIDVAVRVVNRTLTSELRWREAFRQVRYERLQWRRYGIALIGFASFHVIYICYRNLKSYLYFFRGDVNYDAWLDEVDRWLFFGAQPGELMHSILGTGLWAHLLDSVYLVFLPFVPISVAIALMWGPSLRQGFWYVNALSLNWIFGTASYYIFPALGPIYAYSEIFDHLPHTGVARLQGWLESHRLDLIADPIGTDRIMSIAAFASLHTSIVFTAFLVLALLGYRRLTRIAFVFFVLTVMSTIYFGWHYVLDDVAGVIVGGLAVLVAAWITGVDRERLTSWRAELRARERDASGQEPA